MMNELNPELSTMGKENQQCFKYQFNISFKYLKRHFITFRMRDGINSLSIIFIPKPY